MKEYILDCGTESCPLPLIKTEKQMRTMEIGDVIIVKVGSSCAIKAVPDWARQQGHNVDIEETGEERWDVIIEGKGHDSVPQSKMYSFINSPWLYIDKKSAKKYK